MALLDGIHHLATLTADIEKLEAAIAGVRPFLSNRDAEASYPHALLELNRASCKTRISTNELRALLGRRTV